MKVIHANTEGTVGLVSDVENLEHIGTFSPIVLQKWLCESKEMFGDPGEMHVFVKKCAGKEAWGIFMSPDGDNPLVAVMGKYPEDGKAWGKQKAQK